MGFDADFQKPITGSITAVSQSVDITSPNQSTTIIQTAGTWVGTLIVEGSNDNVTYFAIPAIENVSNLPIAGITTSSIFVAQTNGYQHLRLRSSAWTSGTATFTVYGSDTASLISTISILRGASDGTAIGNVADALKVVGPLTNIELRATPVPVTFSGSVSDLTGTDNITALNDAVTINTQSRATLALTVTGTWVATLSIQGTVDAVNWIQLDGVARPLNTLVSSLTMNDTVLIECAGFQSVRLIATAFTSGTAVVAYDASDKNNTEDPTYGNNNQAIPLQSQLISGSDGTNLIPLKVDSDGRLVTSALTGFGADFAFGDITTAALTRTNVRRTAYIEQVTNAQRSIASASANDTAAGTGARTVKIEYLDQTGAGPFSETVTLNGTTYVNTVATNICFIEQITVLTAGSTGSNVGILTLKAATAGGGATIGTISATNNQTFWAHHYVPIGKVCNITGISCGHNGTTVGSGALFTLNARFLSVTNGVESQVSDFVRLYGQTSTFSRNYTSPIKVNGPARVQMYVTPETSSSTIYRSAFDFFEP